MANDGYPWLLEVQVLKFGPRATKSARTCHLLPWMLMKSNNPCIDCPGNYDWMNSADKLQGQWTKVRRRTPPQSMTTTNHLYKKDVPHTPQQGLLGSKLTHCRWPVVLLPKLRHTELQQVRGPFCQNLPSQLVDIHTNWEARSLSSWWRWVGCIFTVFPEDHGCRISSLLRDPLGRGQTRGLYYKCPNW